MELDWDKFVAPVPGEPEWEHQLRLAIRSAADDGLICFAGYSDNGEVIFKMVESN